jgi:hypothetical protein
MSNNKPNKMSVTLKFNLENEAENNFKKYEGKILTFLDATFSDPKQRKAMKDIFKQELNSLRRNVNSTISDNAAELYVELKKKNQADGAEESCPHFVKVWDKGVRGIPTNHIVYSKTNLNR